MIDTGNVMLEIFNNGAGIKTKGALRHIAFAKDHSRPCRLGGYDILL